MKYVFEVVDLEDRHIGFVKDSLLHLSYFSKDAKYFDLQTEAALALELRQLQSKLDIILSGSKKDDPLSSMYESIYNSTYNNFTRGELKVIPKYVQQYLF